MTSTSSPNTEAVPPYVSKSPVGFHVTDLQTFLQAHPTPTSKDPERHGFLGAEPQLRQMFPQDAAGRAACTLMIHNKTRDTERICPSCRRIYRVGEGPKEWDSFEAFMSRVNDTSSGVDSKIKEEQDLSGICNTLCFNILTVAEAEGWSVEQADAWVKANMKEMVPIEDPDILEKWMIRKTTAAEESASGIKLVWEKR